jgi:hypothetical protein
MILRVSVLACVLAVGSARAAPGFAVVLTNDVEHAKITLADVPGQRDVLVVAWQDVPGVTPASGAMIYAADRGSSEARYFASAAAGGSRSSSVDEGGAATGRWSGSRWCPTTRSVH